MENERAGVQLKNWELMDQRTVALINTTESVHKHAYPIMTWKNTVGYFHCIILQTQIVILK